MNNIPVLLVHGSLGSGKTTLIKHLLNSEAYKHALLIENEFASKNIDSETLGEHKHIIEISGGCVCCTSGEELEEAINSIVDKSWKHPVIIETTGIVDSRQLIKSLFLNLTFVEHFSIMANIYVLDPLELSLDAIKNEKSLDIKLSDLVILNKADLIDSEQIKAFEEEIKHISPETKVVIAEHAQIQTSILDNGDSRVEEVLITHVGEIKELVKEHNMKYFVYNPRHAIDKEQMISFLKTMKNKQGIMRVKGFFLGSDDTSYAIEATRNHYTIKPIHKRDSSIVFIGEGNESLRDYVEEYFNE